MTLTEYLKAERGRAIVLAQTLKIPASSVSQWASGKREVPLPHCADIERCTGGEVTCEKLRPDLAWARVRDARWRWHRRGRPVLDVTKIPVAA